MRFVIVSILSIVSFSCRADIPWGYEKVANEYDIPPIVLYSVALQESQGPGIIRPWPWTVNVSGKGHYFDSRSELYRYLNNLLDSGLKNFDIGLGQVNWRWHHSRFDSLWDATDPYMNLRVAASILQEHYQESGSWKVAIGKYHAPNDPDRARRYVALVEQKIPMAVGE
jgi:hypothetical protein